MLSQVSITLSMRFLVSVRLLSPLVVIANVLVHLLLIGLVHPMSKNDVLLFLDIRRNNVLGVKCAPLPASLLIRPCVYA